MLIDAVVLAGGRSSRLGAVAKASLVVNGHTLREIAVAAALTVARTCVVVGPGDAADPDPALKSRVLSAREDPPYSGPAAALAAGVRALSAHCAGGNESDAVLVLACDMPNIAAHVPVLVHALATAPADVDGIISVDDSGHRQPLASLYRYRALVDAISRFATTELNGLSMRALLDPFSLAPVAALLGATDDVDTWQDAVRLGATNSTTATEEDPE